MIDMMYYDEEGVYFLTTGGKVKNIGKKNLDIMFEKTRI